ncbi:PD-(D/E)XK nuclease family protein [Alicyclobacillus fructus]|uniref:PD-(D/E)XK nuclease family protein n=1 Tax=Alicyclobacillus fructus TaxID=2816082 RepID=UPI002E2A179A|nr:PD-(D/E)XK nuclease family protein [Alicyclobacillus fructus]
MEILTHSRIAMRQVCPQKEHFHYVERLRPREVAWSLSIGTAWHRGLEEWQRGASEDEAVAAGLATLDWIRPESEEEQYKLQLERIRVECMIRFAVRHFQPRNLIAVEQQFELPIVNPKTGHKSRKFKLGGKIDAIAEDENGVLWILENKTVGIGLEAFRETFGLNNQYTLYYHAVSQLYDKPIGGVIVRSIAKTRTEPKRKGGEIVESWNAYKQRLWEMYEAEPDKYLAEDIVIRTPEQIKQFQEELWFETQERLWQAKSGFIRHNLASCNLYGGCPFKPLCLGVADARESMFYVSSTTHDELNETA